MNLNYKLYKELAKSYLNELKNDIKRLKYKTILPLTLASTIALYSCDGGKNNNPSCCEPPNNPPVVTIVNPGSSVYETGDQINYQANVSDPDGDSVNVYLEVEKSQDGSTFTIDSINSDSMIYNPINGYYEKTNVSFNDGYIVKAKVRATDTQGLETILNYNNLNVYVSEADAQTKLESIINNLVDPLNTTLKTKPISFPYNQPMTSLTGMGSFTADALLLFDDAVTNSGIYVKKNNPVIPFTRCSISGASIDYIALNDDLTGGTYLDKQASMNANSPCPLTANQQNIGYLILLYEDTYGGPTVRPTTKQDIDYWVDLFLVSSNDSIDKVTNYGPVADAGPDPPTQTEGAIGLPILLNGQGNDSDGFIQFYEWDTEGDGLYESGILTNGDYMANYAFNGCYYATLRVTDDDNLQSTNYTIIDIGNVCP